MSTESMNTNLKEALQIQEQRLRVFLKARNANGASVAVAVLDRAEA